VKFASKVQWLERGIIKTRGTMLPYKYVDKINYFPIHREFRECEYNDLKRINDIIENLPGRIAKVFPDEKHDEVFWITIRMSISKAFSRRFFNPSLPVITSIVRAIGQKYGDVGISHLNGGNNAHRTDDLKPLQCIFNALLIGGSSKKVKNRVLTLPEINLCNCLLQHGIEPNGLSLKNFSFCLNSTGLKDEKAFCSIKITPMQALMLPLSFQKDERLLDLISILKIYGGAVTPINFEGLKKKFDAKLGRCSNDILMEQQINMNLAEEASQRLFAGV
jgi:hypothetical protein